MTAAVLANFIIGGTEKAGTTSVYSYLSEHPAVCASTRKETDFFRREYTGEPEQDAAAYAQHFNRCEPGKPVVMEASPGYLGEAATVAPRIHSLVPGTRLLFLLRNPIDRLYSSFNFHQSRHDIPESLTFSDYVAECAAYDRSESVSGQVPEWNLRVLRVGCYAEFLAQYYQRFPAQQIKVQFFEELRDDPLALMCELSEFLRIDPAFWSGYEFRAANVTFSGRNKWLHRLAVSLNDAAEPVLRHRPKLKQAITQLYKTINQSREGYDPMPAEVRDWLRGYYAASVAALAERINRPLPESWRIDWPSEGM